MHAGACGFGISRALTRAVVIAFPKTSPHQIDSQSTGFFLLLILHESPDPPRGRMEEEDDVATTVSIQLNGAEYMDLIKQAGDVNMSLPSFVLLRCGVETWREEAARTRPAPPPCGRPVRLALERRSVTVCSPIRRMSNFSPTRGGLASGWRSTYERDVACWSVTRHSLALRSGIGRKTTPGRD